MDLFTNETEALNVGDLTVENRLDSLDIYGSITRSREGIEAALLLMSLLTDAVITLRAIKDLPEKLPQPEVTTTDNPFQQ